MAKKSFPGDTVFPGDISDECLTERGATFCVGERVERAGTYAPAIKKKLIANGFWKGVIVRLARGKDNRGRPKAAARVRYDGHEPDDFPTIWLFEELKHGR